MTKAPEPWSNEMHCDNNIFVFSGRLELGVSLLYSSPSQFYVRSPLHVISNRGEYYVFQGFGNKLQAATR